MKLSKKGDDEFSLMIIGFFMGGFIIVAVMVIIVLATVAISTDYQHIPTRARGEILAHRIIECFGGSTIETAKITDQVLQQCYPVGEYEHALYPVKVQVHWGETQTKTAQSKNFKNNDVETIMYPVIINDNGKNSVGTITIGYEAII